MSFNEREIKERLNQLVSVDPTLSAWVQVRPKESTAINFAIGESADSAEAGEIRFPIYSIAKTILALIALRLSDDGQLELDAPISRYLQRSLPPWVGDTSLALLLSHRSGLFDYGPISEYHERVRKNPGVADSPEHFISEVFAKGPQFAAGSSFFYSNIGYYLVRKIVESISGKDVSALFQEMIGSRLKVDMPFLNGPSEKIISGRSPYLGPNAPDVRSLYDFKWVFHGTFMSSLGDLTKLFSELPTLISAPSFQRMTRLQRLGFPHPDIHPSYGLGLMGDLQASFGSLFGHNGGGPGFSVAAYSAPERDLTVAAVINRDSSIEAEKLAFEALKCV